MIYMLQGIFLVTPSFSNCDKYDLLLAWIEHGDALSNAYPSGRASTSSRTGRPARPPPRYQPLSAAFLRCRSRSWLRARRRSSRSLREASSRFIGRLARIRVAGNHLLEPFAVDAVPRGEPTPEAGSDDATSAWLVAVACCFTLVRAPLVTLAGFVILGSVVLSSTDANSHLVFRTAWPPANSRAGVRWRRTTTSLSGSVAHAGRADLRDVAFRLCAHLLSPLGLSGGDGMTSRPHNRADRGAAAR